MKRNYINKIKKMTTAIFIIIMILGQTVTVNAVENIDDSVESGHTDIEEKQEKEEKKEEEKQKEEIEKENNENTENTETRKNEPEKVTLEEEKTEKEEDDESEIEACMLEMDENVMFSRQAARSGGGWDGDYWRCASQWDMIIGVFQHHARKLVLVSDVVMKSNWMITDGGSYTIRGNGHQLINDMENPGPMIVVQNGSTLITEGNLTLNGNCHRNNGTAQEGGSSVVDCVNSTWYGTDTTVCNNWNVGYSGVDHLGGGTGYNIVAEDGSGRSAKGVFRNCVAYNCDGAAFFARNTDGCGATISCDNCRAYDSSWGFMTIDAAMYLNHCDANANRYDQNKFMYGGAGISYMGNASGNAADCVSRGANCGLWVNANNCIEIKNTKLLQSPTGVYVTAGQAAKSYLLENCDIYENTTGIGNGFFNRPVGEVRTSHIRNNKAGIINGGTITMSENEVFDNNVGIENGDGACIIQKGGVIRENTKYDVEQKGEYQCSGDINISGSGIWLAKDRQLTLVGELTGNYAAIPITLEEEKPVPGRLVVWCAYNPAHDVADQMKNRFQLTNTYTTTVTNQGQGYRAAVLRAGTGENAPVGQIVASECYDVTFDGNIKNTHVTFELPKEQNLYWKETQTLCAPTVKVYYDGRDFYALRQVGWSREALAHSSEWHVGTERTFTGAESVQDYRFYAQYEVVADVQICGNAQSAGEDYVLRDCVGSVILPQNTFERQEINTVYNANFEKEEQQKKIYAHTGWAMRPDAIYRDADVRGCGTSFDLTQWEMNLLWEGKEEVGSNGKFADVVFYSVWDTPPEIEAHNRYFSKEEVEKGCVNEEELLRTAKMTDAEDGDALIKKVELPTKEVLMQLGDMGYITARYIAEDGVGNRTERLIKIGITEGGIYQGKYCDTNAIVIRRIDEENYQKKTEQEGGLMEQSLWYEEAVYRQKIQQTFKNLKQEKAVFTDKFTL